MRVGKEAADNQAGESEGSVSEDARPDRVKLCKKSFSW